MRLVSLPLDHEREQLREPVVTVLSAPPDGAVRRGFTAPTVVDGLRSLAAVVGAAAALELWSRASSAAGVHGVDLAVDEHVRVAQLLVQLAEGAPARAAAVSHLTRLRAHRVLSGADR